MNKVPTTENEKIKKDNPDNNLTNENNDQEKTINEKSESNNEKNGKRKKTVSSLDKFGSRILKDESKVFDYNAWYLN